MKFNKEIFRKQLEDVSSEFIKDFTEKRLTYLLKSIHLEKEKIGKVVVEKDFEHSQSYEVAAWYTNCNVPKGEYDAFVTIRDGNIKISYEPTAIITKDYTPAIFGGVVYGNTRNDDVGKKIDLLLTVSHYDLNDQLNPISLKLESDILKLDSEGERQFCSINFSNPKVIEVLENRAKSLKFSAYSEFLESVTYLHDKKYGKIDYNDLKEEDLLGRNRWVFIDESIIHNKEIIENYIDNFVKNITKPKIKKSKLKP